jgi:hypothetical protein
MWHVMDPAPRKAALARSGLSTDHYKAPATAQTATPHAPRPQLTLRWHTILGSIHTPAPPVTFTARQSRSQPASHA